MRFFNYQFPNSIIRGEHIKIKFENGTYDTTDAEEIKVLTLAGIPCIHLDEIVTDTDIPVGDIVIKQPIKKLPTKK